ncbi:MAG: hypothetical protein POELPBGB_02926 [Bacteroidia bacterium]|nr:hypothetical protein [Bacteroidia bacterium]
MNKSLINPSITFFRKNEGSILGAREVLFSELNETSSVFAKEAHKILKEKLNANSGRPLLGELFPWIIKDLIKADPKTTDKISVGWLGIYLYTIFLDEYVDNPKPLSPQKFITGSLLAKSGLLKLSRYTINSPYENYVDKALSFSALNQNTDVKHQKKITKKNTKAKYSEGKNYVLLSCAGALAAQNSKHAEFILKFSETLLLTLQYLDDISDYNEDYKAGNMTVLLNEAFKNNLNYKSEFQNISNDKLLENLIVSGALKRVIEKVEVLLNQSILLIRENGLDKQMNSSIDLFITLQTYISSFSKSLKINSKKYRQSSLNEQGIILDETRKYISIIAQSS